MQSYSLLFLWHNILFMIRDGQCPEYSGKEQAICAVGLAKSKPGVFVEAIQYLLVLATPVEVITRIFLLFSIEFYFFNLSFRLDGLVIFLAFNLLPWYWCVINTSVIKPITAGTFICLHISLLPTAMVCTVANILLMPIFVGGC